MDPRFRLVYTGKLAQGADGEEIITTLVERFRLSDAKARALIRGSRRNLKHDLSLDRARRYRETLERIGLLIDIEPEGPGSRESSFMSFDTSTDPAPEAPPRRRAAPEPGSTACPKCGAIAVSPVTGVCDACGVVAERYLARHGAAAGRGHGEGQGRLADSGARPRGRTWIWIGAIALVCALIVLAMR
jgi:hypothetical protein